MASVKQRGKFDYNFDQMAKKFQTSIYGSFKGELRLEILKEDLAFLSELPPMEVWDAGCGMGQMALWFAQLGHQITCNDISYKMLELAKANFAKEGMEAVFVKASAQEVAQGLPEQSLVLFHAVLEWLAKPKESLEIVANRCRRGGYLSLLFFNQHSLILTNGLKGAWRHDTLLEDRWYGRGSKLTPPHPQKPSDVREWLGEWGFEIVAQSGIRIFHDYMSKEAKEKSDMQKLYLLEKRYAREMPYIDMARYIHIVAKKVP